MNLSRNHRLMLFGTLYFAQGTLMSYFLTFNILYLGESGYGPADVGIFSAVMAIPFVLKIFLGMLSDSVNLLGMGHRVPYIFIGLIGQAVAMLVLPHISIAEGLGTFALIAFFAFTSMALNDTCTDGLALDTTPENERGIVQGVMTGARAAGILVVLLMGGLIVETRGWSWIFYVISISVIPPLLLVWKVQEDPNQMQRQEFQWSSFKALGQAAVLGVAGLGLLYSVTLNGLLPFLSYHLRETFQVSLGNIGLLIALSMLGRILGALSNSQVTDHIGYKQSLYIAIGLTSAACFGLAFSGGVFLIAVFAFLFGLAYGYYTSVYGAVAMSLSDPHISASMYAIFMMFVNLGAFGGQILGGVLTENLGFNLMVLVMGLINLASIFLVVGIFRNRSIETSVPVSTE